MSKETPNEENNNEEKISEEVSLPSEKKERKPLSPHRRQKDSWHREFGFQSRKLIYLEYDGPFLIDGSDSLEDGTKIIRLSRCNRSLGVIEGVIISYDKEENEGIFSCEGKEYPFCFHMRRHLPRRLDDLTGETGRFNFRPLIQKIYLNNEEPDSVIEKLRIERVRKSLEPENNYLEVTGKIDRITDKQFFVLTWDFRKRRVSYVPFWGSYPYPDELGQFAWLKGRFEPETGKIHFVSAESISFLTREEAKKALHYIRKDKPKEEI